VGSRPASRVLSLDYSYICRLLQDMKGSSMGGITIENGGLLRHDGASPNPRTHEAIATLLDPPFPHPRPQAVAQCGIKIQSDGSITQLQLMSTLFSGALRPRVFETARGAYLAFSTTCSDPAEVCFYPTDSIGMLGQDKKKKSQIGCQGTLAGKRLALVLLWAKDPSKRQPHPPPQPCEVPFCAWRRSPVL
jgi:hypothetical protein